MKIETPQRLKPTEQRRQHSLQDQLLFHQAPPLSAKKLQQPGLLRAVLMSPSLHQSVPAKKRHKAHTQDQARQAVHKPLIEELKRKQQLHLPPHQL